MFDNLFIRMFSSPSYDTHTHNMAVVEMLASIGPNQGTHANGH